MSDHLRWVRTPLQSRSQKTLGRLLDATATLLEDRSFDEVSIADIVAEAHSSVGSFYARFADKSALLQALHEQFCDEARATMGAALGVDWGDHGLETALEAFFRLLVADHGGRAGLRRAFLIAASRDPILRERHLALHGDIAEGMVTFFAPWHVEQEAVRRAYRQAISVLDCWVLYWEHPDVTGLEQELVSSAMETLGVR